MTPEQKEQLLGLIEDYAHAYYRCEDSSLSILAVLAGERKIKDNIHEEIESIINAIPEPTK